MTHSAKAQDHVIAYNTSCCKLSSEAVSAYSSSCWRKTIDCLMAFNNVVKALDHVVLTVHSIPATVAFYEKLLGVKHEVFTSPNDVDVER